jgi:hypothetical protein
MSYVVENQDDMRNGDTNKLADASENASGLFFAMAAGSLSTIFLSSCFAADCMLQRQLLQQLAMTTPSTRAASTFLRIV